MTTFNITGALSLATLAAVTCAPAWAQESTWYLGGNAGRSAASIDDARITSGLAGAGFGTSSISDRNRANAYKLYGGYQFNRNFALEGGYFDLGSFGYTANTVPAGTLRGDIRLRGLNLDAVGTLPISERLSALGRIGLNYAQARDNFSGTGAIVVANPSPSARQTNYKLGLGLAYAFTDALSLRLEGERYRVNDAVGNKGNIDMLSLGLVYSFGAKSPTLAPRAYAPPPEPVIVAAAPPPPPPPPPVAVVAPPPPPSPSPTPAPRQVSFSADSLFDFDRAEVKPAGKAGLDKFADELKGTQYESVKVTGNTDRIGSAAYNQKLSTRRAAAVAGYLVQTAGIPQGKISFTGVGSSNPVTQPGDCKGSKPSKALIACLQPDRRVDVEVRGTR